MSKSSLVALILLAAGLQCAQAAPESGAPDAHPAQKEFSFSLGDTIHQTTDRAAELVRSAMGSIGVPYRRGGTSAETGFDCSGFVRATYEQAMGLVLPRRAEEQAAATDRIDRTDLQPGDLVFFNTLRRAYSHVGIYLGEGRFIHSPRKGSKVRVESMEGSYWQKRFNGARRVLQQQVTPGTPSAAAPKVVLSRETPAPSAVRLGGSMAPSTVLVEPEDTASADHI